MGTLQKYNQAQIRKHLLYLLQDGSIWWELADGTYVGKGECGCLLEIRPANLATTVLSLQHKSWRSGCRLLRPNVVRTRERVHGKFAKGQTSNSKSLRPLSRPHPPLSKSTIKTLIKLVKQNIAIIKNEKT